MSNTTKLRITVTKEILERAKYCNRLDGPVSENCAISLAVRDFFPRASTVPSTISPFGYHGHVDTYIKLPIIASNFIFEFDNASPEERVKMKPVSFEVEVPDAVINEINIDEIRPLLQNHPNLSLIEQ